MIRKGSVTALETRLGYQFSSRSLLEQALSHRSAGKSNNERLEFLGDAILGFVIAHILFQRYPSASEGELSRWRSQLVQRSTLAELARNFQLGSEIKLGMGELKSGGVNRESILADAMEALVSAVFLDSGLETCARLVAEWFEQPLLQLVPLQLTKDAKTRLQEWLQARRKPLPVYAVESVTGNSHQQVFAVSCTIEGSAEPLRSTGSTRKEAEQKAAILALQALGVDHE